jgi:hypothetical protein
MFDDLQATTQQFVSRPPAAAQAGSATDGSGAQTATHGACLAAQCLPLFVAAALLPFKNATYMSLLRAAASFMLFGAASVCSPLQLYAPVLCGTANAQVCKCIKHSSP